MEFVIDTSFAVDCKARALYSRKVFLTYTASAAAKRREFFEIFSPSSRKTSEPRRSNLPVVRSVDAKSDAEIGEKMKKKSSLTSLRKDNEVKLEEIN